MGLSVFKFVSASQFFLLYCVCVGCSVVCGCDVLCWQVLHCRPARFTSLSAQRRAWLLSVEHRRPIASLWRWRRHLRRSVSTPRSLLPSGTLHQTSVPRPVSRLAAYWRTCRLCLAVMSTVLSGEYYISEPYTVEELNYCRKIVFLCLWTYPLIWVTNAGDRDLIFIFAYTGCHAQ